MRLIRLRDSSDKHDVFINPNLVTHLTVWPTSKGEKTTIHFNENHSVAVQLSPDEVAAAFEE